MSESIRKFDAEFKKTPGTLTIADGHIYWTPSPSGDGKTMDRQNQAMSRVTNMLASKADSKKTSLKLIFKDEIPAGGLLFTFTGSNQVPDRQTVQDILIPYVSANRTGGPMPGGSGPGTPVAAAATPGTPTAGPSSVGSPAVNGATTNGDRKGKRKAEGTPEGIAKRTLDYELRKRVLRKNPNLRTLYKELVQTKELPEEDFWEGREALLQAEEMAYAQRPGRTSRLLDDRFDLDSGRKGTSGQGGTGVGIKKQDSGPVVLNLSKELTREIFEEFPVVQDAYARHVPGISEAAFWSRYFTSQLWERHRASVRQNATEEIAKKKDDIFDQYLEEPDWNQAPRNGVVSEVNKFLDLAATEEDHGDADVIRDHTMQAGRERSSLPLIRRFNEHSNKLLRHGTEAKESTLSNTVLPDDIDIYDEIDLEDLHGPAERGTITLEVSEEAEVPDGEDGLNLKGIIPGKRVEELLEIAREESSRTASWEADFRDVSLTNVTPEQRAAGLTPAQAAQQSAYARQKDGQVMAMSVIRDLHDAANLETTTLVPFPDAIFEQIRSCHNAATEFLRQYWSAILPTPSSALGAGTSATGAAAKAAKAEKMATYLETTEGKVNAVIHTAKIAGVDPERVRAALAPTVGAVRVALDREKRRVAISR